MERIESSDALVAVLTRRDRIGDTGNRWTTSDWVKQELTHAHAQSVPAIAFVEDGVETSGPMADHERIPFRRDDLLDAWVALAETFGLWAHQCGYTRMALLLPDRVGHDLRSGDDLSCRYRFISRSQQSDWVKAEPVPGPGGTVLWLKGVPDQDAQIQVEILCNGKLAWWSDPTPQSIHIELKNQPGDSEGQ
jgi:hypothetical protein